MALPSANGAFLELLDVQVRAFGLGFRQLTFTAGERVDARGNALSGSSETLTKMHGHGKTIKEWHG